MAYFPYSPSQNPATRAFEAFLPKPTPPPGAGLGYGGGGGGSWGAPPATAARTQTGGGNPPPPSVPSVVTGAGEVGGNPMDVGTMEQMMNAPDPATLLMSSPEYLNANASDRLAMAAKSTIGSNQQLIDSLLQQRQQAVSDQIPGAQKNVDDLKGRYEKMLDETIYSDKLKEVYDKFQLDTKIQQLTEIQNKLVSAQSALDQGMIYEGDRPIRLELISGRQATLKAQGMATIGALQATAQVIQGNINMAYSYADATINTLKMDTERSMKALDTLMGLANENLVSLKKDEKDLIEQRMKNLEKGIDQVQQNKEKITDLLVKYPNAALKGSVNYLDTPEEAVLKMLPTLSQEDQIKLALEQVKLEQAKLTLAQSKAKGAGGGGSGGKGSKAQQDSYKSMVLQAKNGGMSYPEAIMAFGDVLEISWINSVFPEASKLASTVPKEQTAQQQLEDKAYGDVVTNPDKYNVTFNKEGKLTIQSKAPSNNSSSGGGIVGGIKSAFNWATSWLK